MWRKCAKCNIYVKPLGLMLNIYILMASLSLFRYSWRGLHEKDGLLQIIISLLTPVLCDT